MKLVELKVYKMSSICYPADAYALVLKEVDGDRKLPIIINKPEAQSIKIQMEKYIPPRPLTHDLFITLIEQCGITMKEAIIHQVKDGVYYTDIYFEKDGEEFKLDSRASDAIALAMRYKCPFYTTEEIMETEHLHDMGEGKFSMPVTSVSLEVLENALRVAIENEEYEDASQLRDEIRKRKGES